MILGSKLTIAASKLVILGFLCVCATLACDRSPAKLQQCPYRCVLRDGAASAACPPPDPAEVRWTPVSVPSDASIIEQVSASHREGRLEVAIDLRGGFTDAVDQNLYIFFGRVADARAGESWSLSDDPAFFEDLGYPVRSSVPLPGPPLRRVAILSPKLEGYSPQIYEARRGQAAITGAAAPVTLENRGNTFRATVGLGQLLGADPNEDLWVTVATARDYVGFISDATVARVAPGGASTAKPTTEAMRYPSLNVDAQKLASVALARRGASLELALRTVAPITDWAQTNVSLYFTELPTPALSPRPRDASKHFDLPAGWSFYCAIYSPKRVFCRRPDPATWAYDESYAERPKLETPAGVAVDVNGADLRVTVDALAPGHDVGVVVEIGRDGFAPTTVYGVGAVTASAGDALCHR